jgi:hypothetical protein
LGLEWGDLRSSNLTGRTTTTGPVADGQVSKEVVRNFADWRYTRITDFDFERNPINKCKQRFCTDSLARARVDNFIFEYQSQNPDVIVKTFESSMILEVGCNCRPFAGFAGG